MLITASDNDGQTTVTSPPTSTVLPSQESLGAKPSPGTGNANNDGPASANNTIAGGNGNTAAGLSATGIGAPNGISASETAQLHLGTHSRFSRSYAHRAFHLTGRLLDAEDRPIGTAVLDILQQITTTTTLTTITHAKTRPDGTFTVSVPAGPSRTITVAYRAFTGDTNYAAQAQTTELVNAGVQLHITPQHTNSEGKILLTGQVNGPIPKHGVIVDLLVHYRSRWEPFRTPRTDAAGRFKVTYQFQGGLGRFPFRAEVPSSQADFSFARGISGVVNVATN